MGVLIKALTVLVISLAFVGEAGALKPGAGEIFTLVNGTLASSCAANTVVTGGAPLSCASTLPSAVAISGSQITLDTASSNAAGRIWRDASINRLRYGDGTRGQIVGTSAVNAKAYLACDGVTDDRAALNTLVNSGDCAGKDCVIPAGCTLLLSSPGAGGTAVTLASGTRIICEDRVASTIVLARHYCSGGSQPGSYGDTTNTCRSGTLTCDSGSGDGCEFAPTPGSTYTVFGSTLFASKPAVIGCKIDTRQIEAYGRCAAGSQSGKACSTADTNATTGCPSSTCTASPLEPSGDGKITAIDFIGALDGTIDDAEVYNIKVSDYAARVGSGVVRHLQIDSYDANTPAVIPTFTSLTSLLTANGTAVFDSMFGRGVTGIDGGASSLIVQANRFSGTTNGIAGTGGITAVGNKVAALSGGGGTCIKTGSYSEVSSNNLTGCATGIYIGGGSQVANNTISATRFGVVGPGQLGGVSDSRVVGNYIDTFTNTGISLQARSQAVGNYITAGAIKDTTVTPNMPSTGVGVFYFQNLVANNYFTGQSTMFYGIHAQSQQGLSYNIGVWNNRFAFGPVGPAIVTGGAGWHINDNYFNQVAGGWCSDATAASFMGPCTCTTKQCSVGSELGKNCVVDGDCAGGGAGSCATIATTTDNPYGKYGGQAGTCFATGLNGGGTCDAAYSKGDCAWAPIIQVGEDAQLPGATTYAAGHPSMAYGRGFGSGSAHIKIEGNILARGTGQEDIRIADPLICSGSFIATCQGSGGNAGAACAGDSECTSTGCIWGTGNCCGQAQKLCTVANDCQPLAKQCNSLGGVLGATCATDTQCAGVSGACQTNTTSCSGVAHTDLSITSNYLYAGYQAVDVGVTNAQITGFVFTNNTVGESVRGIKFPAVATKLTDAIVQASRFKLAVAKTGSEMENWNAAMGIASGNFGLSGGEQETTEVYLVNASFAAITAGYALQADTLFANGARHAAAGVAEGVIGVAGADSAANGDPVRVVLAGVTTCYVSATVAIGDRLTLDAAVAGNLVKVTLGTQGTIARALAARTGAGPVACLVAQGSGTFSSATQTNFAFAKKTIDESWPSSTTFQADDHLFLTLTAGTAYAVDGYFIATSGGAGGGIKLAIEFSAGLTNFGVTFCGGNSPSCGTGVVSASSTSLMSLASVNNGIGIFMHGTVKPSSTGVLKVWWAQSSSSATATLLKTGSYIRAIAIP